MRYRSGITVAAFLLASCSQNGPPAPVAEQPTVASYVGGAQCAICHAEETGAWRNSHHDLAMQPADSESILGDFSASEFSYNGVTSEFFQRDSEFWVSTDGPDGELTEYRITHAFGVEPLQQYLVETEAGRTHALSLAWDSRPTDAGGQRWFHLYPDDAIDNFDPLHWTGNFQNWNGTCAECHSTDLRKNFSLETSQYDTTFASVDVDCEACHGPGSLHVAAPTEVSLRLPNDSGMWRFVDASGIAQRNPPLSSRAELETCAQCHARRSQFTDNYTPGDPFLNAFQPTLLEENLYHADGQIQDEVYVYGSFLQSRMHAAGVTCSDCHDPHSAQLQIQGNALCSQCHLASNYDVPVHHQHEQGGGGSQCVDCHMPETTYMVVDPRRDHSFRIPRPDLSISIGAPNACTGCHTDETDEWAATTVADWFPEGRHLTPHYGEALHAGRSWTAEGGESLRGLVADPATPAIVRATAITLLARQLDDGAITLVEQALQGDEPLLQLAALDALQGLAPEARVQQAQQYLTHSLKSLRMAAARVLLPARANLSERRLEDLDRALAEYRDAQLFNSDRPEGLSNWGTTLVQLGRSTEATEFFQDAIERAPYFTPAYVNLADLLRLQGLEPEAEQMLRDAIENNPESADAHYALGLSLVRSGEIEAAFAELKAAAELAPHAPHYQYVIAIALHSGGDSDSAIDSLVATHERFPGHRDTLLALATIHRDAGLTSEALNYTNQLLALSASDPDARSLLTELESLAQ